MTALKRLPLPFVGESSTSKVHALLRFKYHERGIQSYLDPLIHFVFSSGNLPTEAPQSSGSFKGGRLQKLFSTFPSEWPGVGLLLLRVLVTCSLIAQSISYVQMPNPSMVSWGLAALTFAGGAFLLVGLMTPFMAVLVATGGLAAVLSWIPLAGHALSDSYPAILNLIVLSIAIALLGPGAFSLDARMFVRCLARQTCTTMSTSREFSPTTCPP